MANAPTVERQRRAFVPDEAWLAKQAPEPILEPELPIIDPHHHLWDHRPRMTGDLPPPRHRFEALIRSMPLYLFEELLADMRRGHNVIGTVYMAMQSADFEYHGDKEKTRKNRIGAFFTVGDVGVIDEDGYLFLRDRKIDMVIKHGADQDNRVRLAVNIPNMGELEYQTVCGKFLPIVTRCKTKSGERLILAIRVQPCKDE